MYYDFSRVIDRVIYRYQRVYSHFRIPFPFDYSILFSLHRSYLSLLNAQRKKLEKKRFQHRFSFPPSLNDEGTKRLPTF